MVRYSFVMASLAGLAAAVPLNINLGAYSPALVVGDGEISFGGNQDVSSLMNVLEGAAVNTATRVAGGAAAQNPATGTTVTEAAAVANPAADPNLQEQAQQIARLQGLGKEIAPRMQLIDVDTQDVEVEAEPTKKTKRDLAGFDRALTFAEAALTKGPKVQLGTGKLGSGVGIVVDNNQEAAARTTGGAEKRDVEPEAAPKRVRAKVTTMYVRSGIPASLQSKRDSVAPRAPLPAAPAAPAPAPASRRDAIDAVNLNVDGDQGLTMTFVETVDDDDE